MTQKHLFKTLLLVTASSFMQVYAMEEVVTLQSNDGQDFQVELDVVKRSKTLEDLIEDAGTDKPIPLPNISGRTLMRLVDLMREVHKLQAKNEAVGPDEQIYIPREYQLYVHQTLKHYSIDELVELAVAANYLDSRFILNAATAEIADQMPEFIREDALRFFFGELDNAKRKRKFVAYFQEVFGLDVTKIQKNIGSYIGKHLQFRSCGIKQEYSIADFISYNQKTPRLFKPGDEWLSFE